MNNDINNTSLRVGMICGLLVGIDPKACEELIKNESGDFRYVKETKAVLHLWETLMGDKR